MIVPEYMLLIPDLYGTGICKEIGAFVSLTSSSLDMLDSSPFFLRLCLDLGFTLLFPGYHIIVYLYSTFVCFCSGNGLLRRNKKDIHL